MAKIKELLRSVQGIARLVIMPHNNPDPDAIASSVALRYLLETRAAIAGYIAYQGIIGRAENRALAQYLSFPLEPVNDEDFATGQPLAFVDTQPGAGNISAPDRLHPVIVIDRHSRKQDFNDAAFVDIRTGVGATSTLLVEYFRAFNVQIPDYLATGLFYGIKTNTMGLSRNAGKFDAAAYYYLQPIINVETLAKIEQARVPSQYFRSFEAALRTARIYSGLVISYLGDMQYPDLVAEIADLLLRLENARWVVCMGLYNDTLFISVRTRQRRDNAEKLLLAMVQRDGTAGGHGTIAGGQIRLNMNTPESVVALLSQRALRQLNLPPDAAGTSLFE